MSPRPHKFHFYCDENFPVAAGEFLKSKGHSVVYAHSVVKSGVQDVTQLAYANKYNLTFLTVDKDFINPSFSHELIKNSCGVLIIQTDTPTEERYQEILRKFLLKVTPNQAKGRVFTVSIDKTETVEFS